MSFVVNLIFRVDGKQKMTAPAAMDLGAQLASGERGKNAGGT